MTAAQELAAIVIAMALLAERRMEAGALGGQSSPSRYHLAFQKQSAAPQKFFKEVQRVL